MALPLALVLALVLAVPGQAQEPLPDERPNILVIMTDDQRADMMDVMPLTRWQLGQQGTTFTDAHVTTPKCCPSRASLFTGLYAHNHGVIHNSLSRHLDQTLTSQRILRENGYRTGYFGKYFNGWEHARNPPHFDRWAIIRAGYRNALWNFNGRVRRDPRYSTNIVANQTLRFIRRAERDGDRPWIAWATPYAPHLPSKPASRHRRAPIPEFEITPGMTEQGIEDKPAFLEGPRQFPRHLEKMRDRGRRSLVAVDEMVAQFTHLLRSLDAADRTLVIFTSDNGFMLGEHGGLTGKSLPYTEATRVPLIVRWPGRFPAGEARGDPVTNVDVATTIFEAAGVPRQTDGRSLLDPVPRRTIFTETLGAWANGGRTPIPPWRSIRNRSWRYGEYYNRDLSEVVFREFYDLRADPWELENLAGTLSAGDLSWYSARLNEIAGCKGETCP